MAKQKYENETKLVTEYIEKLDEPFKEILEALRQIILKTDPEIDEHIKWNSPSFFYKGEMQPFDPKEYKRDIAVVNLYKKDYVLLVFPTGAKVNDASGLLEGDYKDGRRLAKFLNPEDVKSKSESLQAILTEWLSLIER